MENNNNKPLSKIKRGSCRLCKFYESKSLNGFNVQFCSLTHIVVCSNGHCKMFNLKE